MKNSERIEKIFQRLATYQYTEGYDPGIYCFGKRDEATIEDISATNTGSSSTRSSGAVGITTNTRKTVPSARKKRKPDETSPSTNTTAQTPKFSSGPAAKRCLLNT
jgi:hypothetical protein